MGFFGGLLTGAGQTLGSNLVGGHKVRVKRGGGCYIATAVYGSYDCPQVWTLRRYRDFTLAESWLGRAFVRVYCTISPTLVKWFGQKIWSINSGVVFSIARLRICRKMESKIPRMMINQGRGK
jgi:hypothetical protein